MTDDVLLMHGICMNDGWCMNEAWVMDHAWIVNDAWVFRYPQPLIVLVAIVKVNLHVINTIHSTCPYHDSI